jgi:hypothetical protein
MRAETSKQLEAIKRQSRRFAYFLLVLSFTATSAHADTIFSNLGPAKTWDTKNAYVINGAVASGTPRPFAPAMSFTPSFNSSLTSIELPLGLASGTDAIRVELLSDNKGTPGSLIESIVVAPKVGFPFPGTLMTATSALHPALLAKTPYWIAALPGGSSTAGGWLLSAPLQTDSPAFSSDGGATWVLKEFGDVGVAAFEVDGTPLPEPGALVLGGCLAPLLIWRTRARS